MAVKGLFNNKHCRSCRIQKMINLISQENSGNSFNFLPWNYYQVELSDVNKILYNTSIRQYVSFNVYSFLTCYKFCANKVFIYKVVLDELEVIKACAQRREAEHLMFFTEELY